MYRPTVSKSMVAAADLLTIANC